MKTCSKCGLEKAEDLFPRDLSCKSGFRSQCRECRRLANAERERLRTPEKIYERELKRARKKTLFEAGYKTCSHCKEVKLLIDFNKNPYRKDGKSYYCKACNAVATKETRLRVPPQEQKRRQFVATLKGVYGLEPEDYAQILLNQQNKCAICREDFQNSPHIDHCHKTGKIRGLLCRFCNQGMGFFKDLPDRLIAAANYLDKSNPLK